MLIRWRQNVNVKFRIISELGLKPDCVCVLSECRPERRWAADVRYSGVDQRQRESGQDQERHGVWEHSVCLQDGGCVLNTRKSQEEKNKGRILWVIWQLQICLNKVSVWLRLDSVGTVGKVYSKVHDVLVFFWINLFTTCTSIYFCFFIYVPNIIPFLFEGKINIR